jgi:hypothetical protein
MDMNVLRVTNGENAPRHEAGACKRRTVFALSGLSGSADLLPTVGSGIRPDLLTFRGCESARGLVLANLPPVGNCAPP